MSGLEHNRITPAPSEHALVLLARTIAVELHGEVEPLAYHLRPEHGRRLAAALGRTKEEVYFAQEGEVPAEVRCLPDVPSLRRQLEAWVIVELGELRRAQKGGGA